MRPLCATVKSIWTILVFLGLVVATPVHAQESEEGCTVGSLEAGGSSASAESTGPRAKCTSLTNPTPAVAVSPSTEAERRVQEIIGQDGLHVVHFWAPWSANVKREFENGWPGLVTSNPNVTFTFVTVWNEGENGRNVLNRYDIPDRVTALAAPTLSSNSEESSRRRSFLTHPVTWVPSTWIFHNNGELAFALNYGEMDEDTLQSLLNVTRTEW